MVCLGESMYYKEVTYYLNDHGNYSKCVQKSTSANIVTYQVRHLTDDDITYGIIIHQVLSLTDVSLYVSAREWNLHVSTNIGHLLIDKKLPSLVNWVFCFIEKMDFDKKYQKTSISQTFIDGYKGAEAALWSVEWICDMLSVLTFVGDSMDWFKYASILTDQVHSCWLFFMGMMVSSNITIWHLIQLKLYMSD